MVNIGSFPQTELFQQFFKMVIIMNSAPSIGNTARHQLRSSLVFRLT